MIFTISLVPSSERYTFKEEVFKQEAKSLAKAKSILKYKHSFIKNLLDYNIGQLVWKTPIADTLFDKYRDEIYSRNFVSEV
jgi:hypothetical protein